MTLRPLTLIGIVISMVTGIALGISGHRMSLTDDTSTRHTRAFDEVLSQVQANYVEEVGRDELVEHALRGMLDGLDSYSDFLDMRDYDNLQAETTGQYGGIGIELGLVDDVFTVVTPLDGTPASRAGLQSGDRLLAINKQSLKGKKNLIEVVGKLRGKSGSRVAITYKRGSEEPRTTTLTRAVIEVASVRGRLLEPGFAYMRISQFQTGTSEDFSSLLAELSAKQELDGLVLDLRNNPGGLLQASVDVADTFLKDGLIVYTEGRLPSSHLRYRASGRDLLGGAPIVVLINHGSASAAEIVAGALQDHERATLLGSKSYGKGSVQSVLELSSGKRALKLTTSYYYTPSGRSIHELGIQPDIVVATADNPTELNGPIVGQALVLLKQKHVNRLHARL
jgi:carboxyl-terminal processing protease